MCTFREQELSQDQPEIRWKASCGDASDPNDVVLLAYSDWSLHLRLDFISSDPLVRTCNWRMAGWFRVYFPLQLCQQLPGYVFNIGILRWANANRHLVDTYQHQAASALAAKTFLRSMWGASTVLFTEQMYDRLGYQWASSLLAFIALACCAIPYVFFYKGEAIRRFSKYAFADDEEQAVKA